MFEFQSTKWKFFLSFLKHRILFDSVLTGNRQHHESIVLLVDALTCSAQVPLSHVPLANGGVRTNCHSNWMKICSSAIQCNERLHVTNDAGVILWREQGECTSLVNPSVKESQPFYQLLYGDIQLNDRCRRTISFQAHSFLSIPDDDESVRESFSPHSHSDS